MRYIVGLEMIDKYKDNPFIKDQSGNGLYAFQYLDYFLTPKTSEETILKSKIQVFDDLEKAQNHISKLSKAYRRDDVAFSPKKKSRFIRHFYLIKLDSPKCPIIVDETTKELSRSKEFYWYKIKGKKPWFN